MYACLVEFRACQERSCWFAKSENLYAAVCHCFLDVCLYHFFNQDYYGRPSASQLPKLSFILISCSSKAWARSVWTASTWVSALSSAKLEAVWILGHLGPFWTIHLDLSGHLGALKGIPMARQEPRFCWMKFVAVRSFSILFLCI